MLIIYDEVLKSFKCNETHSPLQFPLTAEKAFVAPYGVQRFLTGCGTTTGPVVVLQCSHWQPPALVVGSFFLFFSLFFFFFFLMVPHVSGSASSVVLTFTTAIKLHVMVVNCA